MSWRKAGGEEGGKREARCGDRARQPLAGPAQLGPDEPASRPIRDEESATRVWSRGATRRTGHAPCVSLGTCGACSRMLGSVIGSGLGFKTAGWGMRRRLPEWDAEGDGPATAC